MDSGAVVNGTVADSSSQAGGIWRVREGITEALTRRGMFLNENVGWSKVYAALVCLLRCGIAVDLPKHEDLFCKENRQQRLPKPLPNMLTIVEDVSASRKLSVCKVVYNAIVSS